MSYEVDDIVQINSKDLADNGDGPASQTMVILVYADNKNKIFTCSTINQKGYSSDSGGPWTFAWGNDSTFELFKIGTRQENSEFFL